MVPDQQQNMQKAFAHTADSVKESTKGKTNPERRDEERSERGKEKVVTRAVS